MESCGEPQFPGHNKPHIPPPSRQYPSSWQSPHPSRSLATPVPLTCLPNSANSWLLQPCPLLHSYSCSIQGPTGAWLPSFSTGLLATQPESTKEIQREMTSSKLRSTSSICLLFSQAEGMYLCPPTPALMNAGSHPSQEQPDHQAG